MCPGGHRTGRRTVTGAIHAGIDCGTNSIRLLVARLDGDRLVDLDRRMLTIRLGEGLDESGVISGAALDRAAAACDEYSQVLAGYEVSGLRFVATSASRDAENATTFTDLVQRHLHVLPEVIDGGQEAALSFLGARRSLDVAEPTMVVDIGGGSTEFVRGGQRPQRWFSSDIGCVRLHERHGLSPLPTVAQVAALRQDAAVHVREAARAVGFSGLGSLVAVAGTATTVAALALGLPEYDASAIHGSVITRDQIDEVAERILSADVSERLTWPVMHPGRADVIASGVLILQAVVTECGARAVTVSEHDILDGIVWSQVLANV